MKVTDIAKSISKDAKLDFVGIPFLIASLTISSAGSIPSIFLYPRSLNELNKVPSLLPTSIIKSFALILFIFIILLATSLKCLIKSGLFEPIGSRYFLDLGSSNSKIVY